MSVVLSWRSAFCAPGRRDRRQLASPASARGTPAPFTRSATCSARQPNHFATAVASAGGAAAAATATAASRSTRRASSTLVRCAPTSGVNGPNAYGGLPNAPFSAVLGTAQAPIPQPSAAPSSGGAGGAASASASRAVPLPGQALWLLDPLQDRFFNVSQQKTAYAERVVCEWGVQIRRAGTARTRPPPPIFCRAALPARGWSSPLCEHGVHGHGWGVDIRCLRVKRSATLLDWFLISPGLAVLTRGTARPSVAPPSGRCFPNRMLLATYSPWTQLPCMGRLLFMLCGCHLPPSLQVRPHEGMQWVVPPLLVKVARKSLPFF
eukprot:38478-Chlamydomonas_euryale.AAC.2